MTWGLRVWRNDRLALCAAVGIGVFGGVGAVTFDYGEGLSYFSRDPAACANCHIMQPQYDSWQKSGHHTAATCVDCHLPHDFVGKYLAKADNGYRHSKAFTFQDFHEPIQITEGNHRILQENCMACHQDVVHEVLPYGPDAQKPMDCTHCHRGVGHGPQAGLGGPDRTLTSERNAP